MTTFLEPVHKAFNHRGVRKALLVARVPLGLAAVAWVAWQARLHPEWFWPGLAVSAFGALFQWWCFSCIMTSKELAARGPYTLTRNPMYIARLFLVLGLVLMAGSWPAVIAVALLYYFYMVNRVKREEVKLREIFGAPYEDYLREVNRFVPWPGPRTSLRTLVHAEWRCFKRNNGPANVVLVLVAYGVLYWWVLMRPAS